MRQAQGRAFQILVVALLLLVARGASAEADGSDVVNFEAAPYSLTAVAEESPIADAKGRFTVEFYLHNTSPRTIHEVGVRAAVFARDNLKGYHVFTLPVKVAPGEKQYVLYTTSAYTAGAGDRAVLLPVSAKGTGVQWRQKSDVETEAMTSLERARGDVKSIDAIWAADQNPEEPSLENPKTSCRNVCLEDRTRCEASCVCGMSSHSCSCSDEGLTVTCNCNNCP